MKYLTLVFACVFVLTACQDSPEVAEALEPVEVQDPRPDPNNPVGENLTVPADWNVRFDRPDPEITIGDHVDSADVFFVNMTPGWHITSGPSGIYYHPNSTAEGNYTATVEVFLFDPGERREAFGMIIGGSNLDQADQTYDYFLIRNSGEYLIKRRTGEETSLIQDWTASEAVVQYTDASESSVLNKLTVQAGDSDVAFTINGVEVARLPRTDIQTDGIVGLRVNHALNLHVSNLQVEEAG